MVRKIEIKNIQSHKDSELSLCNGINVIVGSSNNGKSAILRALNWAIKNRPLGTDILLSHWATDEKGIQKEEMYVKVTDDVGNTLIRRRTKQDNQYIVNGKELNVVKTDVPDEVNRFFRLSDTNIQYQQDSPFLLSLSSGEVARYFNKTVKLDMIDKILAEAEARKRKIRSEKEILENDIKVLEEKLNDFSWTDGVDILISKYKRVHERNNLIVSLCNTIEQDIDLLKKQKIFNMKDQLAFVDKILYMVKKTEGYENEITEIKNTINKFNNQKIYPMDKQKELLASIEEAKNELSYNKESINFTLSGLSKIRNSKTYDFTMQKNIVDEITELVKGSRLKYDAETLQEDLEEIIVCNKDIQDCNSEVDELWQEMPEICPVCGKPLDINKKC